MKSVAFLIIVLIIWGGIFFYFGRATAPEMVIDQPDPAPAEAFEVPATIEATAEIVKSKPLPIEDTGRQNDSTDPTMSQPAKQNEETTTLLVNKDTKPTSPIVKPDMNISATYPFYFEREGASFGVDIIYRYADRKFRFENMRFKAPKRQIVYRDRLLKFGSAMGLLVDSQGDYKLLLQPINFSLWKFEFYPTVMVDPEYQISYGGLIGLRW